MVQPLLSVSLQFTVLVSWAAWAFCRLYTSFSFLSEFHKHLHNLKLQPATCFLLSPDSVKECREGEIWALVQKCLGGINICIWPSRIYFVFQNETYFSLCGVFKLQLMQSWILALQYSCQLKWFFFSPVFFFSSILKLYCWELSWTCCVSPSFDFSFLFLFVLDDSLLAFWNFSIMCSLNDNAKTGS